MKAEAAREHLSSDVIQLRIRSSRLPGTGHGHCRTDDDPGAARFAARSQPAALLVLAGLLCAGGVAHAETLPEPPATAAPATIAPAADTAAPAAPLPQPAATAATGASAAVAPTPVDPPAASTAANVRLERHYLEQGVQLGWLEDDISPTGGFLPWLGTASLTYGYYVKPTLAAEVVGTTSLGHWGAFLSNDSTTYAQRSLAGGLRYERPATFSPVLAAHVGVTTSKVAWRDLLLDWFEEDEILWDVSGIDRRTALRLDASAGIAYNRGPMTAHLLASGAFNPILEASRRTFAENYGTTGDRSASDYVLPSGLLYTYDIGLELRFGYRF